MHRRRRIIVGIVLVAFLSVLWLFIRANAPQRTLTISFTTAKGHFPEPPLVVANLIAVAWVTNTGRFSLTLDEPYVQFENAAGQLVRDHGSSWNQQSYSADLPPGSAAWLANGFDADRRRQRFVFEFHRNGGPLVRVLSKAVGLLPVRQLPASTYDWLHRNGMIDGVRYGHYESIWIANPHGGASGQQPSSSEADRTSATAGSGHSP